MGKYLDELMKMDKLPSYSTLRPDSYAAQAVRAGNLAEIENEALKRNQGPWSRELEAGWEQTKGSVARTVGEFTGWQGAKDYADERAAEGAGLSAGSGMTQSLEDVDGVGSLASYTLKSTLNTLPAIASMIVPGGAVAGGLRVAGAGINAARGAGAAAAYSSNVLQQTGGNLDAQIEEGGEVNLLTAGAAGLAQGALDTFTGVGGRALSAVGMGVGERAAREAGQSLTRYVGGKIVRTAGEEFLTEGAQQVLEEGARYSVKDPGKEFDVGASLKRVAESAVTGGLVGGALGGALPNRGRKPIPSQAPGEAGTDPLQTAAADAMGTPDPEAPPAPQPDIAAMGKPVDNTNLFKRLATGEVVLDKGTGSIISTIRGDSPLTKPIRDIALAVTTAVQNGNPDAARSLLRGYEQNYLQEGNAKPGEFETVQPALQRAFNILADYELAAQPMRGNMGIFQERMDVGLGRLEIRVADKDLLRNAIKPLKRSSIVNETQEAVRLAPDFPESVPELIASFQARLDSGRLQDYQALPIRRALDVLADYQLAVEQTQQPAQEQAEPDLANRMAGAGVPISREGAQLAQGTVDANIAQAQAQQVQEQQAAAEQAAVEQEQSVAVAEQARKEQKQAVADARLAKQAADLQPTQYDQGQVSMARDALLAEVQQNPSLDGRRLETFIKRLRAQPDVFGKDALPTPEETKRLAKTTRSIGKSEGVKAPVTTLPQSFTPVEPQAEGMFDAPSQPARKLSKAQREKMDRVGSVRALRPTPDAVALETLAKDVTKKFEELAERLGDTFGSQLDALIDNLDKMTVKRGADVRTRLAQVKQVNDALARIERESQGAQPIQAALPLDSVPAKDLVRSRNEAAAAAKAETISEPAPVETKSPAQKDLFSTQGKPTPTAKKETNAQVKARIESLTEKPNDGNAEMHLKQMQLRRLARVVGAKGITNKDINQTVDSIINPATTTDQARELADTLTGLAELADPTVAPPPAPVETTSEPEVEAAVEQEAESAAFQETDDGDARFQETDDGDTRFRVAPKNGKPAMKWADVQGLVNNLTKGWRNPPKIIVYNSNDPMQLIPAEARGFAPDVFGAYVPSSKIVYINQATMDSPETVKATLYHEALGHYGLRERFGKMLENHLRAIWMTDPFMRSLAERYMVTHPDVQAKWASAGKTLEQRQIMSMEEAVVVFAERADISGGTLPNPTFWQRTRSFIAKALRSLGINITDPLGGWGVYHFIRQGQEAVTRGIGPVSTEVAPGQDPNVPVSDVYMPRIQQQVSGIKTSADMETFLLDRGASPWIVNKMVTIRDNVSRGNLGMMLKGTLIEHSKKLGIVNYARVAEIQEEARQITRAKHTEIDQLINEALRLDPTASAIFTAKTPRQDKLKAYMYEASYNGKWGYQPTWMTDKQVTIDPEAKKLADKYRAADKEGFEIADKMLQYAYTDRKEFREAVENFINGDANVDLAKALTKSERMAVETRRKRQLKIFRKSVPMLDGPYFPLMRFGNYATVAKSAEFVALENKRDQTSEDRSQLMEMRSDPDHYAVLFRDTFGDAREIARELESNPNFKGGNVYASTRTEDFNQLGESPLLQMQKLKQMVSDTMQDDKYSRELTRQIESMLSDLYIRSLAENSARKYDRRRDRVTGADRNMLRAFSEKMRTDANALGHISTYSEEMAVTKSMMDEINQNQTHPQYENRKRLLREVLMRRAQAQNVQTGPLSVLQDRLMAISSIYHLATSPRYYIMNIMQPGMFTAPLLAGRFGLMPSWQEMNSVYSSLMPVMKSVDFWKGEIDFGKLRDISPDDIEFLKAAQRGGTLDFGAQLDAGFWQGEGGISRGMTEANHMFRVASAQVEFINRTAAGLAAYRLAKKNPRDGVDPIQYGKEIIEQTQFNYSTEAQPRYFNMLPRITTQFRKYQVGQLALQGRLLKNMLLTAQAKGMSSSEFREATAAVGYMYGQLGLVTGALGIPGMQIVGVLGSLFFGDDDEPLDGDRFARQVSEKLFGKEMGQYALRGIPTMAGLELDGVGLGAILNPLPYFDYGELTNREGVRDFMFQAGLGAFGGILDRVATKGLPAALDGDVTGTADAILPSGFRNALRGYLLSQEGVTKSNGDMLLRPEEVSVMESMFQGLGFIPPSKRNATMKYYERRAYEDYYKDRTTQMKRGWLAAKKDGDSTAMRDLEQQWKRVQEAKTRLGLRPSPLGQLYAAEREAKTRQRKIDNVPIGFR